MSLIIKWLITSAVAYGLSLMLSPHIHIDSYSSALLFVLILGILNAIVKPILVILTLPITILTLGIFLLVINVLMVILADNFISGIHIDGFLWALIFAVLLSVLSSAINKLIKK